jgi:hypothetical protein
MFQEWVQPHSLIELLVNQKATSILLAHHNKGKLVIMG